ncbi:hypothetical protein BDA96_04G133700 [Sorghum bicolor]|uniref:Uncharacterized protein n=2 Tax=Sorghum bicolor TaxID=4558 RepID=A0A1Z5RMK6_SORBI|nr:hypothetical protein BDA96_04G133700 [Sorghum bicolor]OQU84800.1 hypothetical protein SORBI_3004G125701 [Sorghum bicolor]OQU84801.1 hypothetical protein SORBI_3004G125701 [Sorghum bicolor]
MPAPRAPPTNLPLLPQPPPRLAPTTLGASLTPAPRGQPPTTPRRLFVCPSASPNVSSRDVSLDLLSGVFPNPAPAPKERESGHLQRGSPQHQVH